MSYQKISKIQLSVDPLSQKERGASTVEWAGMTLVGVILLLAVAAFVSTASGGQIGQAVLDGFEGMISAIQSGGVSVGSADAPAGSSPAVDAPAASLPSIGVSQAVVTAVNPDGSSVEADSGDGGGGGFLGQVGGFFVGIYEGGRDTVVGIATLAWDGVRGLPITGDIYGIFDPEGRDEVRDKYGALWDAFVDDPLGTGGDMLYAMVEPIVTDWEEGRYGEAVGRSLFEIALFFVPGDEVGKVGVLGRIDQMLPDEIFATLARADRLTPDELAGLLARIDNMTPEEMADFLRRMDQMTPDELERLGFICSFSGNTSVATATGARPISTLAVGDSVLGWDEATGSAQYFPVTAVWSHIDAITQQIVLDGETIETTPEHPFYTSDNGWQPALTLVVGDLVQRSDGGFGEVESISFDDDPQAMYNITVAVAHNYFVGDGQWLVHNACNYELIYQRLNSMTPDEFSDMLSRLDDLPAEELRALQNYRSRWESLAERAPYADEFGRYNLHHGYPRDFRDFFYERGIDIDNPQNMFELPQSLHTRLPDGIHTGPYPESWNGRWDDWIANHPNATRDEIIRFREQLAREFDIEDYLGQAPPVAPPGIPPRIDD